MGQKSCKEKERTVSPKGTPRPVILSPVPSTSDETEPEPEYSARAEDIKDLHPPIGNTPMPCAAKDEENENESKQPDSSDNLVDASRKITEVANILHRERLTAVKTLAEQHNSNSKNQSHAAHSASKPTVKPTQQHHVSPHRELRSRESIQVAEVSSSVCTDNAVSEETPKSEHVSTTKLEKVDHPVRPKRICDLKPKESTTSPNLQNLIRQLPKPSGISDHEAKEESNNPRVTMVRQRSFNGSCDELKSSTNIGTKRRHSIMAPADESCTSEPSLKRRTRSEDQRVLPTDENDPANQSKDGHSRLSWPDKWQVGEGSENPRSNQRRSLEKKVTPVKSIRRPSINGGNRIQLRGSFTIQRERVNIPISADLPPQRWLRSDTIAATPIKTLRSRNVDIMGHTVPPQMASQYGIAKTNRLSLPSKLKQTSSTSGMQGTPSNSGIAKRVKSPYNPSARSLSTRSRIKRLSK